MKSLARLLTVFVVVCYGISMTACPLCQGGQGLSENTISAYKGITLLLALMPLVGSASIFYWIHRRQRAAARLQKEELQGSIF